MPNILVADDNPVSLRFFADALTQLGAAAALANDGLEAAEQAERERFDLLLLDARMPGLDGAEALARIRSGTGPSSQVVAVATTADSSGVTRDTLLGAGFADVLTKPLTVGALRAALARYVSGLAREASESTSSADDSPLDDAKALLAAGGDAAIVAALRGLLISELDALPAEIASMVARGDVAALRDRLHRLDASAGFCGAPGLARAGAALRSALDAQSTWPQASAAEFLAVCAEIRALLAAR